MTIDVTFEPYLTSKTFQTSITQAICCPTMDIYAFLQGQDTLYVMRIDGWQLIWSIDFDEPVFKLIWKPNGIF
jgi:hypothetical protein